MTHVAQGDRKNEAPSQGGQNQASQTRLKVCSDRECNLWASTDLETIQPENPDDQPEDILLDGKAYRRLSPDYYLWLKARFEKFQLAVGNSNPADENAAAFIRRFETLRAVAQTHYSLADLKRAKERLAVAPLSSPNQIVHQVQTPKTIPVNIQKPTRPAFLYPPDSDLNFDGSIHRFTTPVTAYALEQVNAIRDDALLCGWSESELYQNRGRFRFPYGQDYGIACFIDPGQKLGDVTPDKIELICRGGHSLYFRRRGQEHLPGNKPNNTQTSQEAIRP